MIFLPRGVSVRQKVNPARINIPEAMEKLRVGTFTGYLRFDAPQGCGVIIFETGKLVSAFFVDSDGKQRLIAYDAISKIFEISILGDASLNIYKLTPQLALEIHSLLHGKYIYKEQDLKLIDVRALLNKISAENLTGCLRVYTDERSALIFYDEGHALGFFHDGSAELQTTADLSSSVARLPGAKVDLLSTGNAGMVLADLMASADLGPIWQRLRKSLLQERSQREEAAIRTKEEELEDRRQQLLTKMKTIAGKYVGKFGVAQVEKAFANISSELRKSEVNAYFVSMERLAQLVAKPEKIALMIDEMKRDFN
ncbi:hypothetical protein SAMN02745165_00402 [Malonomonas rubra DSM 5091]|uniref:DUF4388 domain-containing protein n=1 Tax=Malonomonas rubra DSM 5091 TaxID=1122189 RepID=A0A1M6C538_MALRU|nr:hypothetical protein [Malonomonas rubra]SHI55848.1 hypothetical protein SAMN02745165_00402 [Malonomonas rubra DSM 5091]